MLPRARDPLPGAPSLLTRAESRQQLRLRRFWLASAASLLYLFALCMFHLLDKLDRTTLAQACTIVIALICAFFVAFRSGVNLRFSDPSLTVPQLLASVLTMVFVVYRAPDSRLAFTAFFFLALTFGMLRCSSAKLTMLGLVSLAAYALAIWLRYRGNANVEMLRLDSLQCLAIAVTFPWVVFIGGRVKRLQRDLIDTNSQLEDIQEQSRHDDLTGSTTAAP